MFGRKIFYDVGRNIYTRSFKCGGTNATNERIADKTNETNRQIATETNTTNLEQTRQSNETNVKIAQETNAANIAMNNANNELQQRLQDQQNDFNYRMWQENNEYNSPAAQIQRAAQAGLNPNSALGNAVASSPVQQVSLPNTQAGHADPYSVQAGHVDPWRAQGYTATFEGSPEAALFRLVQGFTEALQQEGLSLENENKQFRNSFAPAMLSADLSSKTLGNDLLKSNISNTNADTQRTYMQIKGIAQSIEQSRSEVALNRSRIGNLDAQTAYTKLQKLFDEKTFETRVAEVGERYKLTKAQAGAIPRALAIQEMVGRAQAGEMNASAELKKAQTEYQIYCKEQKIPEKEAQQIEKSAELYASQAKGQDLQNKITKEYGPKLAKENLDRAEYENSFGYRTLQATSEVAKDVAVGVGTGLAVKGAVKVAKEPTNGNYFINQTGQ